MHFGNGAATRCRDVGPDGGGALCSDLNTTRFLRRVIEAEKPDLIAFTGALLSSLSTSSCSSSTVAERIVAGETRFGCRWPRAELDCEQASRGARFGRRRA